MKYVNSIMTALLFAVAALVMLSCRQSSPPNSRLAIIEKFDDATLFSQTSDNIYVSGGKAVWNFSRNGGDQFIYRSVTPFTGNFRITVVGQIDDWTSNCRCGVGIGDAPGSGVAINFGFFGGGCSTSGPVITASGVSLNMQENDCQFTGRWPWITEKTPYQATLTVNGSSATLDVEGVGQVDGIVDYSGEYSVLWVGGKGDGDWPSCSGSIESVTVKPLK